MIHPIHTDYSYSKTHFFRQSWRQRDNRFCGQQFLCLEMREGMRLYCKLYYVIETHSISHAISCQMLPVTSATSCKEL